MRNIEMRFYGNNSSNCEARSRNNQLSIHDSYISRALYLQERGHYSDAIVIYERQEKKFPLDPRIKYYKACCFDDMNKDGNALKSINDALGLSVEDIDIYIQLCLCKARILQKLNCYDESIRIYMHLTDVQPDNYKGYEGLIICLYNVERYKDAYLVGQDAVSKFPNEERINKINSFIKKYQSRAIMLDEDSSESSFHSVLSFSSVSPDLNITQEQSYSPSANAHNDSHVASEHHAKAITIPNPCELIEIRQEDVPRDDYGTEITNGIFYAHNPYFAQLGRESVGTFVDQPGAGTGPVVAQEVEREVLYVRNTLTYYIKKQKF